MTAQYSCLNNKHVLITGGGSGIGEALVSEFHAQGAVVSFIDIDEKASLALQSKLNNNVHFYPCDLRDVTALQATIKQIEDNHGAVHCLINNAACDNRYDVDDITQEIWDDMHAINARPVFFAIQAVHKSMKTLGGGSIINFTSTSYMKRAPRLTPYATAKAGMIGLTRVLSRDLGVDNIRVNSIMPGWIMTQRQKDLWFTPEIESDLMKLQSLKALIQPEEVAKLALFLASDDSKMITAQNYVIDGGVV
ncbi:MAG: SDR family oxidoreductase [Alphaproteobacteria bacterium]|nr:SDR family oxidoreductase [Alphaproteobacteria bacterium]